MKENQPLKGKIAAILKRIADAVAKFFRGDKEMKLSAHNRYAQTFLDDVKALRNMAELVSKGFDSARENEREFGERKSENRHSYAGADAQTADRSLLEQAQRMERDGKPSEDIRRETGWHKGYDGKWRFEIDDSGMEIDLNGAFTARKELADKNRLIEKVMRGTATEAEEQRYEETADIEPEYIGDIVKHDKLFAAYPGLRKMEFHFENIAALGYYSPIDNVIVLNDTLKDPVNKQQLKRTLVHEMQHAVQAAEGFASGSSTEHWAEKYPASQLERENRSKIKNILSGLDDDTVNKYYRYKDLDWALDQIIEDENYDSSESLQEQTARFEEESDKLYDEFYGSEWFSEIWKLERQIKDPAAFYRYLYNKTAGEIEARDSESRLMLNDRQRKEKRPDIDRDDVVFADGGLSYSIKNTQNMKWENQVDEYFKNNHSIIKRNDTLVIGDIPVYFNHRINSKLKLAVPLSVITKAQSKKDDSHSVKRINIKKLKKGIENAVAMIYDKRRNSIMFITNLVQNTYPVVVTFQLNEEFDGDLVNKATSIHLRVNIEEYLGGLSNCDIYIQNKKEIERFCKKVDILDRLHKNNNLFEISVSQFSAKSNPSARNNLNDSDGKFSKDDTIIDPDELDEELLFTSDGDLSFDGYGTSAGKVINVEQLMQEQGAEQAVYTLYNAAARTAERKDFDPHFLGKVRKEKRPDIDRDGVVFAEGGVSYEIGISEDNEQIVIVKDNVLQGVPKKDWVKTVKANMKNKFSKGIPYKGKLFLINKDTRREFTNSKYSKAIRNKSFYKDKMKASNHLDEIIIASTNYINEDLNHQRKDSIVQFARGDITMKIGNHGYEAKILVGFTKDGELLLYDIINMIPKKITIKKGTKTVPVHQQGGSNSSQSVPSGTNIAQSNQNSNPSAQNNLNDSDGKFSKDDTIYEEPYNQYSMVRQQKKNRLRHCRPDML